MCREELRPRLELIQSERELMAPHPLGCPLAYAVLWRCCRSCDHEGPALTERLDAELSLKSKIPNKPNNNKPPRSGVGWFSQSALCVHLSQNRRSWVGFLHSCVICLDHFPFLTKERPCCPALCEALSRQHRACSNYTSPN